MADDNGQIRARRFFSADRKASMNIGAYNGRIDISVFNNETRSAPIIKLIFVSDASVEQFVMMLKKIVSDPEAKPIELSFFPYMKELNKNEYKGSITVGRDQEKVIYFETTGDQHKEPIRFPLTMDILATKINAMDVPKQSYSETTANNIIKMMDTLQGLLLTQTRQMGKFENGTSEGMSAPQNAQGSDIPF